MTLESFPIEYSMTGFLNSAATSRMIAIDSASRRRKYGERLGPAFASAARPVSAPGAPFGSICIQYSLAAGPKVGFAGPPIRPADG
jgi:hypothetical protein